MKGYAEHSLRTSRRAEFVDVTDVVVRTVRDSGVAEGICIVYVPHTTAGITINEHADPSVARDALNHLSAIVPENHGYTHSEGNSDSHIKTILTGPSVTLIVAGGRPVLGTWQGVFFCEYDGPRTRKLYIKVIEG